LVDLLADELLRVSFNQFADNLAFVDNMTLLVDNCVWEILERLACNLISFVDRNEFRGADDLA